MPNRNAGPPVAARACTSALNGAGDAISTISDWYRSSAPKDKPSHLAAFLVASDSFNLRRRR
jgi:hypothetical protein